ncbi:hypothetical protein ACTFIR_012055 [Dictyostelium discoideum]
MILKKLKINLKIINLIYNRIVVNVDTGYDEENQDEILLRIHEYVSNENPEIISNLFKILEINYDFMVIDGYSSNSEEEEEEKDKSKKKKCTEIYFNNLSIAGFDTTIGEDREAVKIFKILKSINIFYDGTFLNAIPTHVNYTALFDPDYSGQQVESIIVQIGREEYSDFVEPRHLIKVNQFENLHSITIPINSFQILSNLTKEMGYFSFKCIKSFYGNSDNIKSELNQMINSIITSKFLKNLKIASINTAKHPIDYDAYYDDGEPQAFINKINETTESFSNSFQPLFSELNTSIERIEFDCVGLLNINTFSNLLNNKSIKYLYLYDSDFIVYSLKPSCSGVGGADIIELNSELKELKFIFNLILNNIFKLQLYSLIFEVNENQLIGEFVKEFKNLILINNISTQKQQQEQKQKSNNINIKEIKIKLYDDDNSSEELINIDSPYFKISVESLKIFWFHRLFNFPTVTIFTLTTVPL